MGWKLASSCRELTKCGLVLLECDPLSIPLHDFTVGFGEAL
jgi:hypothetical protein